MKNSPEDEIIVKNFNPSIDFKKQAIAASIDYYLAAKRVGEYSHYLYDFLLLLESANRDLFLFL